MGGFFYVIKVQRRAKANNIPNPTNTPPKVLSIQRGTSSSRSRIAPEENNRATRQNHEMCATEIKIP